ncbi:MAG: nuclear transport factor 2 family protein [Gammaproteobacteria bacterium]
MTTSVQPNSADPAVDLLYRYTAALDQFDYDAVLAMFNDDSTYRVQSRRNYERNGVLHIVRDSYQQLGFRLASHPPLRLEPTVHVIGNPSVSREAGATRLRATFNIDRNGKPTFSGEYIATIDESGGEPRFANLMVVLEGDSVPGSVQIAI